MLAVSIAHEALEEFLTSDMCKNVFSGPTVVGPQDHPVAVLQDGDARPQLDEGQRDPLPVHLHLHVLHQADLDLGGPALVQPQGDGPVGLSGTVTMPENCREGLLRVE